MATIPSGYRQVNSTGKYYEVLEYINAKQVLVRFDNTGTEKWCAAKEVRNGSIKDPHSPTVCGVGVVGLGYSVVTSPKAYECWRGMLRRCYVEKNNKDWERYGGKGCTVCRDWHNFQVFHEWYTANAKDGYDIDKDIIVQGNLVYSPEFCNMIPSDLNKMLTFTDKLRKGKLGVHYNKEKGKYMALVQTHLSGIKRKYFNSEQLAYEFYCKVRTSSIKAAADYYHNKGEISSTVREGLYKFDVTKK
ncbi:hypothetical protein NVP1193O_219 [Vibrio phage 1.193.O._10N.286.52.C6]|nr:hypothetical protein NVP1193O_219 [Vibrio phage 1.193.O._10N.286.52.C6]